MRLLALALAFFFVPQGEKVTLKFNPKQGDKLTTTTKMEMKLKITVETGGGTQEMEMEQRGTEKVVTELLGVADGKLTKIVKDYLEDYDEEKAPGAEWQRKDNATHGRKITISMKDGGLVREGVEGLGEGELKKLTLDDKESHLFPQKPIEVGETWVIKGEEVRKYFDDGDIKDGRMDLKLVSIKEIDKRRCAVIRGTFDLSGTVEGEMELSLKLDADVVVWIDRGYTLSVKGQGKVTMKGDREGMKLIGQGPMTVEVSTKVD